MDLDELDIERDREGFIILKRTYSDLYKKTNYLSPVPMVINRIYEYDIHAANLSMLKQSGKIDPKALSILAKMDKKPREVGVGKMIRENKQFGVIIKRGILRAREQLFRENQLQDYEVLSIKNDAVFVIGRKLKHTTFGDVEFRLKNQYSLFQNIDKIEFYYDRRHKSIDIKGVKDEVVHHPDHQNGMLQFFLTVFNYAAMDQRDDLRDYLLDFVHRYKAKELPYQYYRELNAANIYRTEIELSGYGYNLEEIGQGDLGMVNPIYNYTRFILPVIRYYL